MKKSIILVPLLLHINCCIGMLTPLLRSTSFEGQTKKIRLPKIISYHNLTALEANPDLKEVFSIVCNYVLANPYMSKKNKITLLKCQMDRTDFIHHQNQQDCLKGFAAMHAILTQYKEGNLNRPFFEGEKTIFHVAAQENNLTLLQEALKFMPPHNRSIDNFNKENNTALHIGAENLNIAIIKTLCRFGANVNMYNKIDRIPSTVAILAGDHPQNFETTRTIVQIFHDHGADATTPDKHNKSTLDYVEDGLHAAHYYERRAIYVESKFGPHLQHYANLKKILATKE